MGGCDLVGMSVSTGGCVLVGMSVSTGGCVLVGRGYECVHRWMCPSG